MQSWDAHTQIGVQVVVKQTVTTGKKTDADLTGGFQFRKSPIKLTKEDSMKYWIGYEANLYVIRDDIGVLIYSAHSRGDVERFYQELIS